MHRNTGLPRVHPADAVHQCLARHVLKQVTFPAGLNGAVDIFIAVKCCEHDDARALIVGADFLDRTDAIELRHSQIKQRHVGTMQFPKIDCFAAVPRFSDHGHVRFAPNQ